MIHGVVHCFLGRNFAHKKFLNQKGVAAFELYITYTTKNIGMKIKWFAKIVALVAISAVVGCQKGPESNEDAPIVDGEGVSRFMATIATPEVSRAMLQGDNTPIWKAGDNMLILSYGGSTITNFKSTIDASSLDGASAYFKAAAGRAITKGKETYSIYPYFQPKLAEVSGGSSGSRRIELSLSEQSPSFDSKLHLPLLVGLWSDDTESFTMVNPLLVVRLNLSLAEDEQQATLKRVSIVSNGDEPLWGSNALFSTEDMSLTINEEGAKKSLSLDCGDEVLGVDGKTISFCIPAKQYQKGLKLKIFCLEGVFTTDIKPEGIKLSNDRILEQDLSVAITKSKLFVDAVHTTDTTIAVAWSTNKQNTEFLNQIYPNDSAIYGEDINKEYKVAIYSDEECSQLVYSASVLKGEKLFKETVSPPRFIFTGLTPQTDYYIHIYNLTDSEQTIEPLKVTTSATAASVGSFAYTKPGDIVLFENFGKLKYGGDLAARAAGVSRDDRAALTSFDGADLKGDIVIDYQAAETDGATAAYIPAAANIEMGLFNTLSGLIDDMGVNDWGWIGGKADANGGSVCARPGYVKVGTSSNRSSIVTPMLSGIPAGANAKVTVKFKAAPYGDVGKDINAAERDIVVKVLNETSIASNNKITYASQGESKAFTLDAERSCDWKQYSVTLSNVQSTSRIAIGGNRAETDTNRFLIDDIMVCVESIDTAIVTGTITYDDGSAAADIVVSDGFSCVKTDAAGKYSLKPHNLTWYIYYSIPAECKIPTNDYGQPCFFTKYSDQKSTYDFTITRAPKEDKFALFCLADVQCANTSQINRFKNETMPELLSHSKSMGIPCYGVTLGDVVYSQGTRNCEPIMPTMRNLMTEQNLGMPVFQTFGNHDYSFIFSDTDPLPCSGYSDLEFQVQAQRAFEKVFGPINYSWNRGDTHIVCMRNMLWYDGKSWDHYGDPRFLDEQYEWLKQDLAYVPTDKMVILCVHCSIENSTKTNVQNILKLLSRYKDAHIMSGHHHRNTNHPTKSTVNGKAIYEHNHGAVCGHFWKSNFNADGSPNGYGVYEIEGSNMTYWYYKGVNNGVNDRDYQLRLYRGNMRCGGEYDHIELQHGANVILANVFNADDNWKIKVYEDGSYVGNMTRMAQSNAGPGKYSPDPNNPGKPNVKSSLDWWIIGYHTGVLGLGDPKDDSKHSGNYKDCFHMYKWTLKNANAKNIKVEATDIWGRTYTCSEITGDYDYSVMQ